MPFLDGLPFVVSRVTQVVSGTKVLWFLLRSVDLGRYLLLSSLEFDPPAKALFTLTVLAVIVR